MTSDATEVSVLEAFIIILILCYHGHKIEQDAVAAGARYPCLVTFTPVVVEQGYVR